MHTDSKAILYSQIWRGPYSLDKNVYTRTLDKNKRWGGGEGVLTTWRGVYLWDSTEHEYMCTWIYTYHYLSWYCHGDGLHKPLRLQLIVSHHLTLHIIQLSLWHVAHASLRVLGLVHVQEEDIGRGISDLKVSNGRITL